MPGDSPVFRTISFADAQAAWDNASPPDPPDEEALYFLALDKVVDSLLNDRKALYEFVDQYGGDAVAEVMVEIASGDPDFD